MKQERHPVYRVDEESTGTRQNLHECTRGKPYAGFVMRGAFVVQLWKVSQDTVGLMEGSVEEVDTGHQAHFRSHGELIAFMRERFGKTGKGLPIKEENKE